jgi:hypothetical protein
LTTLSWASIVDDFNSRYDEVYMNRDAKAHFDYCNEVIDGAKKRWRMLLLLDAIACNLSGVTPEDLGYI